MSSSASSYRPNGDGIQSMAERKSNQRQPSCRLRHLGSGGPGVDPDAHPQPDAGLEVRADDGVVELGLQRGEQAGTEVVGGRRLGGGVVVGVGVR